jgi:hypothetical protein
MYPNIQHAITAPNIKKAAIFRTFRKELTVAVGDVAALLFELTLLNTEVNVCSVCGGGGALSIFII